MSKRQNRKVSWQQSLANSIYYRTNFFAGYLRGPSINDNTMVKKRWMLMLWRHERPTLKVTWKMRRFKMLQDFAGHRISRPFSPFKQASDMIETGWKKDNKVFKPLRPGLSKSYCPESRQSHKGARDCSKNKKTHIAKSNSL